MVVNDDFKRLAFASYVKHNFSIRAGSGMINFLTIFLKQSAYIQSRMNSLIGRCLGIIKIPVVFQVFIFNNIQNFCLKVMFQKVQKPSFQFFASGLRLSCSHLFSSSSIIGFLASGCLNKFEATLLKPKPPRIPVRKVSQGIKYVSL